MKKQLPIPAAIILGVSAGTLAATSVCAQPAPPCTGANHCVDVTIAGGAIQSVANVVVSGTNHQIYWRITTGGYSFPPSPPPPDGIAFKQPSSINHNERMPRNEFACNRISATLFHCTDANSTHGAGARTYQYSISVIDASGHKIVADPWIVNK